MIWLLYALEAWLLLNLIYFWWVADGRYGKSPRSKISEARRQR